MSLLALYTLAALYSGSWCYETDQACRFEHRFEQPACPVYNPETHRTSECPPGFIIYEPYERAEAPSDGRDQYARCPSWIELQGGYCVQRNLKFFQGFGLKP